MHSTHLSGSRVLSPTYATAAKCITASKAFSEKILLTWNIQLRATLELIPFYLHKYFENTYQGHHKDTDFASPKSA